jgi:hypothetical protein
VDQRDYRHGSWSGYPSASLSQAVNRRGAERTGETTTRAETRHDSGVRTLLRPNGVCVRGQDTGGQAMYPFRRLQRNRFERL